MTSVKLKLNRNRVLRNVLDTGDLCRMLNVSKRSVQRYRTSGDLPYQMLFHKTFYKESDVQRFVGTKFSQYRSTGKCAVKRCVPYVAVRTLRAVGGMRDFTPDKENPVFAGFR